MTTPKHDHRRSTWLIAGGYWIWCYRCGAIRRNGVPDKWVRPTGPQGENPAMKDCNQLRGKAPK